MRNHRRSLKNIVLWLVCPKQRPEVVDIADFPALETLSIPVSMLTTIPEDDAPMILAPNLTCLTLDYSLGGPLDES